ncbi:expressed tetratricopeptide repeat protein [Nitzschia inconspicua]|uniref:Expressed tetratricopeptide repeat protein n=1 Tax=Nitzschia inconspicua TaxID=303405 RepID=A0A9K3KV92_9STRA|nr:expressed tetratricopeptide repeat protein [Nitzschia inconspicua]
MSLPQLSTRPKQYAGYQPVEVTHDDYRKTVGYRIDRDDDHNNNDEDEGRNCMDPPRSMTRRIGNMLMPPRNHNHHKKTESHPTDRDNNSDSNNSDKTAADPSVVNPYPRDHSPSRSQCGSSVSGFSHQQSVANKTVDSQVTLKVSNTQTVPSPPRRTSRESKSIHSTSSTTNPTNPYSGHNNKESTWKAFKRLVKGGQKATTTSHHSTQYPSTPQRKHAVSYDTAQAIFGATWRQHRSNSTLSNAYPIRKRIVSDEGKHRFLGYHSTPTNRESSKNIWTRWSQSSSLSSSSLSVTTSGRRNSQRRDRSHVSSSGTASVPGYHYGGHSQRPIDHVIRGRLDGVDILSLGPVSRSSLPALSETAQRNMDKKSSSPFAYIQKEETDLARNGGDGKQSDGNHAVDPLQICFTDMPSTATPADLVADMIWTSGGKDQPEILLEGFHPGGSDRWTVRINNSNIHIQNNHNLHQEDQYYLSSTGSHQSYNDSRCPPTLQSTVDDDESTALSSFATEDGSSNMPTSILWNNLWGKRATAPPIPSHMQTAPTTITKSTTATTTDDDDPFFQNSESFDEEDEVLKFASSCNVPFDLDEDAFIINSPDHLQSVHELAMVSLQSRHFDAAQKTFQKLLRGLDGSKKFAHLVGSTHHNIGMIQLLHGQFADAVKSFERATQARIECLPPDHPDIAVSLQRKATAYFALAAFNKAESCLEAAMNFFPKDHVTRAKILNNIGVVRYQLQDYNKALKSFTSALEMQRQWLEGPVKRESIVYDASVTLINMGKVYLRKGDYDLAYFVFEEACLMQTSSFRKDHDIVLVSLDNMARVHAKNGNQAEALRIFTSLARSQEARYGADSEACIETIGMKGVAHFKLLEFEEAMECMNRVYRWQKKHLSFCHPATNVTKEKIKQIQRCIKGEEELWV